MNAPATPAQPTTISVQGFTDLVLKHLEPVNGVKHSDLEFAARGFFNPVRGRERISVRELGMILGVVQKELDRRLTKSLGFPQGAQDTMRSVAAGFAGAVAELKTNPQAAEPIIVARKPQAARPSVPREYLRPQTPATPQKELPPELAAAQPMTVTRRVEAPREHRVESVRPVLSPRKAMPPEGWLGMVKAAEKLGVAPIKLQGTWKNLMQAAEPCTADKNGIRTVPLGEGHVRMLFGGPRKPSWYMHPDDIAGPLKKVLDATRRVRQPRQEKAANPQPPSDWMGILKIVQQMHTSPKVTRAVLDPLMKVAEGCEADAQGIRTVPLGEGQVRMLFGGPRKPSWSMHPDDVNGPFKEAVESHKAALRAQRPVKEPVVKERKARTPRAEKPAKQARPEKPEGYQSYSAILQRIGGSPEDIKIVWNGLVYEAERATPDAAGNVRFAQKEGDVEMWRGGRMNSWHISENSFEQVFLPRYRTAKRGFHTDRVKDRLIAKEHDKSPRASRMDTEETSLSHVNRVAVRKDKAAVATSTYRIDDKSQFEVSAIIGLALQGLAGRVPADVEDRLRLELNRAFANHKENTLVTRVDVQGVIDQCKTAAADPGMPNESREVYRAVHTTLANAMPRLNTLAPVPVAGMRRNWQARTETQPDSSIRRIS